MKKFIIAITAIFAFTISASAMDYDEARQQALFLTDKMAYELNLTDDQYEAAYEVNLDYLMNVNGQDDLYGSYWNERNDDLRDILLASQYNAFLAASYFYRPLYWSGGFWHFGIYARYPHRNYLYFGRPRFYATYRGGHSWRMNGGRSWYTSRSWGARGNNVRRVGMRNQFNSGKFGRGRNILANTSRGRVGFSGNQRPATRVARGRNNNVTRSIARGANNLNGKSSTRTTVNRGNRSNFTGFGARRSSASRSASSPSRTFTPKRQSSTSTSRSFSTPSRGGGGNGFHGSGSRGGGHGGRR